MAFRWNFANAILHDVDLTACLLPPTMEGAVLTGARLPLNIMNIEVTVGGLIGADTSLLRDWVRFRSFLRHSIELLLFLRHADGLHGLLLC